MSTTTTREQAWRFARLLVVEDGATYAEAAEQTGLPLSTIQKRAASEHWQDQRGSSLSYAAQVAMLSRQALTAIVDDKGQVDPQRAYAWKTMEQMRQSLVQRDDSEKHRRTHMAEFIDALVAYLDREDPTALAAIGPHIRPFVEQQEATWARD